MYHRSPPAVHHPERRPYSCGPKRCRGGAGHTSAAPQPAGGVLHPHHLSDGSLMVRILENIP